MYLQSDEILCREGDFNNTLFIVKDGLLEGTSLQSRTKKNYGPGSILGEFCLVESSPSPETVRALLDSEVQAIGGDNLKEALSQEPAWVQSILTFLSRRARVAEKDFQTHQKIKALPALLYLLISEFSRGQIISLSIILRKMENLVNLKERPVQELLFILEELDMLKLQGNDIRVKNKKVVELLYQAILHRAVHKEASPHILSLTDQMVLAAVIKAVQDCSEPLQNGNFVISTPKLLETAKKTTRGMTLTMGNVLPLLEKKILCCRAIEPTAPDTPMESIHSFYGEFDHVLDLMELNRIYPLLDKKLIQK